MSLRKNNENGGIEIFLFYQFSISSLLIRQPDHNIDQMVNIDTG